ncbi:unnamed protein product, partial [Larinioides sclopetarius]
RASAVTQTLEIGSGSRSSCIPVKTSSKIFLLCEKENEAKLTGSKQHEELDSSRRYHMMSRPLVMLRGPPWIGMMTMV